MEKIIVSACLLGIPCRYDGKSKPNDEVVALSRKYELIPVCAEALGGLPTPRIPAEIVNDKVLRKDGADVTLEYNKGAQKVLEIARSSSCKTAILKSKSPSCGRGEIYDGTFTKTLTQGNGICSELLIKNGITVINEKELYKL